MASLLEAGERVGDHWTVVAAVSHKTFIVRCDCGEQRLHKAKALLGPGDVVRSCGCQRP